MAIRVRVNAVITAWCGQGAAQDQNLKQLWDATRNNEQAPHDGMEFQPDGAQDLIDKLAKEFKKGGVEDPESRKIVLGPGDFEPKGNVKTLDDLVNDIVFSPGLGGGHG